MVLYVWVTVGPAIGRAFGPACVYSEKKARAGPGRASSGLPPEQVHVASQFGLAIGLDGMCQINCAFTVLGQTRPGLARPGIFAHCKRGLSR